MAISHPVRGVPVRTAARRRLGTGIVAAYLGMTGALHAQSAPSVEFDAAFLPAGSGTVDLARFARGNPVLPGTYDVDVWVNDAWQTRVAMRFVAVTADVDASPCVTDGQLLAFGVAPAALDVTAADPCVPLDRRIGSAATRFDVGEQRLDIQVPQAAMVRDLRGAAPREQWDDGATAALFAWRGSARHAVMSHRSRRIATFALDTGINHGAWRFRHAGGWIAGRYRRSHTYLERPVAKWAGRLRLGDVSAGGDVLPPIPMRGVAVASDARMASAGPVHAAPTVRGVATSHAMVRIRQHGRLLRELAVPPGPFVIDDLDAAARGGDLDVDIEESDGSHRGFRIPYFPVPELLAEGRTTFSAGAGRARARGGRAPAALQAAWRHGFAHATTGYAGLRRVAGGASAVVLGAGIDTLAGAFAADVTHVVAPGGRGSSWRVRHGRRLDARRIVSLAIARGGQLEGDAASHPRVARLRRVDASIQQTLDGDRGSLSLSVTRAWRARGGRASLGQSLAWARHVGRLAVDLSVRRSRDAGPAGTRRELAGQLGLSMPLGVPSAPIVHAAVQSGVDGVGLRVALHGTVGASTGTLYGVSAGRDGRGRVRSDASLTHGFRGADVTAALDRSTSGRTATLAASGALLIHGGGVTAARRLGESAALVHADGAWGARVGGYADVTIDRRGYAIVPHLTPYRWNTIDLDPTGIPLDVGLDATHRRVVPTAGAVVLVPLPTTVARTLLVTARDTGGEPVPFGAEVLDDDGRSSGVVGQAGAIFLRADDTRAAWTVRWSGNPPAQCRLRLLEPRLTAGGDRHYIGICE